MQGSGIVGGKLAQRMDAGAEALPREAGKAAPEDVAKAAGGRILHGRILDTKDGLAQIRLDSQEVIWARLEGGMRLEQGEWASFQVKSQGGQLLLRPLFANVESLEAVQKALQWAQIQETPQSRALAQAMMEAGLPIDRALARKLLEFLQKMPQSSPRDAVDLYRLGLPLEEAGLHALASYKGEAPALVSQLGTLGRKIGRELFALAQELPAQNVAAALEEMYVLRGLEPPKGNMFWGEGVQTAAAHAAAPQQGLEEGQALAASSLSAAEKGIQWPGVRAMAAAPFAPGGVEGLTEAPGEDGIAGALPITGDKARPDEALFSGQGDMAPVHSAAQARLGAEAAILPPAWDLSSLWTLSPESFSAEGLAKFYQTLEADLVVLRKALEFLKRDQNIDFALQSTPETDAPGVQDEHMPPPAVQLAARTAVLEQNLTHLQNQLDMLRQVNQLYAFVQLPLKLGDDAAGGELYVMGRRRAKEAAKGPLTALLHLDLAHLGPMDAHISLEGQRAKLHFCLARQEALAIVEAHLPALSRILEAKGYSIESRASAKDAELMGAAQAWTQEALVRLPLPGVSFDMRT